MAMSCRLRPVFMMLSLFRCPGPAVLPATGSFESAGRGDSRPPFIGGQVVFFVCRRFRAGVCSGGQRPVSRLTWRSAGLASRQRSRCWCCSRGSLDGGPDSVLPQSGQS